MRIRTKLLVTMTGLLVALATLSLLLQLQEAERVVSVCREVVEEVAERAARVHEREASLGFVPGSGARGPVVGFHRRIEPLIELDGEVWRIRFIQHLTLFRSDDPYFDGMPEATDLLPGADVLPPSGDETTLLGETENPLRAARVGLVSRQIVIAGAVLLVGLGAVGLLARRMTRPMSELTETMEQVAAGDLDARIGAAAGGGGGSRDEVGKMTAAFNTMLGRLREKRELERKIFQSERLSAMGNLAAGVAHDIRNPLNTIGLTLAHVRDQYAPSDAAARERYLGHIDDLQGEVVRLEELVKNFLSLARPDRGEKQPCDLGALVRDTVRLFRKEAESKGVEIVCELGDVPEPLVSEGQLRAALTNVVVNALHAIEERSGESSSAGAIDARRGGHITLRLFERSSDAGAGATEIVLRVEDDGRGIPSEDLDRVLLPYFTTRDDGTGLGLPVARGALEAHGGRLEIRSRRGVGTEVDLVVPVESVVVPGGES